MNPITRNLKGKAGKRPYRFSVLKRSLLMPDGVRLAATIFMPKSGRQKESFPLILEYLPYRKDDSFHINDYPCFSYFAQHGYIAVKVDIRGTGSSEGQVPDREYSDIEQSDAMELLKQLAALPQCNGKIGMFGVSWSGFNSLHMAMRQPPQLKAIHAVHASDDLFNDDVHYIDGNLHLDPYHLYINHELGLPRSTDYKIDEEYFVNRFEKRPWLFRYLANQVDGDFFRSRSLREDYSRIKIPVYLIGGLLDGYRSATVRMAQNLQVPVRLDIGPWNHSCPDDGTPGPNYEWQDRLMSWFDQFLLSSAAPPGPEPRAKANDHLIFVRQGHEPDSLMETIPGYWRKDSLPCRGAKQLRVYLNGKGKLVKAPVRDKQSRTLAYKPSSGTSAGNWWGELTGDMREDDKGALCYDSPSLTKPLQIIGFPQVRLKVKTTSSKAKWSIRLEDLGPDGSVSLVTGALFNPAHIVSRENPSAPPANKIYEFKTSLHFTTWTFKPGHRIRLAITNAQFPMCWPSPELFDSTVYSSGTNSCLILPTVPYNKRKVDDLPRPAQKLSSPDAESIEHSDKKKDGSTFTRTDKRRSSTSHTVKSRSAYRIGTRQFFIESTNTWSTTDKDPAKSKYLGRMSTKIVEPNRTIELLTTIQVRSDRKFFHVRVTRSLVLDGKELRHKIFRQSFPRNFQ